MNANPILLQKKYARVVKLFAEQVDLTLREALDFFYRSTEYTLVSEGVSDLHCMSDAYLAEDLKEEYINQGTGNDKSGYQKEEM